MVVVNVVVKRAVGPHFPPCMSDERLHPSWASAAGSDAEASEAADAGRASRTVSAEPPSDWEAAAGSADEAAELPGADDDGPRG